MLGNLVKPYALLWERCAKAMQNKIQTRSDFESTIFDDPIELLRAIKQHALNFDETQYSMSIISNSERAFFATVQKRNESVTEYTRRFRTPRDIMESHLGEPPSMKNVVKGMKDYDETDPTKTLELQRDAAERLYALVHLEPRKCRSGQVWTIAEKPQLPTVTRQQ